MPDNLLLVDHRQGGDARARSPRCFHPITGLTCRGDEAVQATGHRRTAAPGPRRQLGQVVVRVAGAQRGSFTQGGWEGLPPNRIGLERVDQIRAGARQRRPCGGDWPFPR